MFRVNTVSLQAALQLLLLAVLSITSSASLSAKRVIESSDNSPGFSYSTDGDASEPIIRYKLHVEMLANIPDKQSISIYGDGRVEIHNPVYMKNAGDYKMQLSTGELNELLTGMASDGFMDFDPEKVKDRVKAAHKSMHDKGRFYVVSDAVDTVVDIKLGEYQKNKNSKKIKQFNKQFRWKNLRNDAARYKNDVDIVRANKAVNRLLSLKKDRRLERVEIP